MEWRDGRCPVLLFSFATADDTAVVPPREPRTTQRSSLQGNKWRDGRCPVLLTRDIVPSFPSCTWGGRALSKFNFVHPSFPSCTWEWKASFLTSETRAFPSLTWERGNA